MTDTFDEYRPMRVALPLREALAAYLVGGVEKGQTQASLVQFSARVAYQGDLGLAERVVRPIANVIREIVHDILVQAAARGEIRADALLALILRGIGTVQPE